MLGKEELIKLKNLPKDTNERLKNIENLLSHLNNKYDEINGQLAIQADNIEKIKEKNNL